MELMQIHIDGNANNIRFSCAHFIPGDWKCDRIHGHDYTISASVYGNLEGKSYFLDFSGAKRSLKEIADYLDHMVLVPKKNSRMKIEETGSNVRVQFKGKEYSFPSSEVRFLDISDTTAECLSIYVLDEFRKKLKEDVEAIEIEVHEGPGQYAKSEWHKGH